MDEALTFGNGKVVNGNGLETETRLFLYLYGLSFDEVYKLLKSYKNTEAITWKRYSDVGEWTGYKTLMSISVETDGMISASLRR